MQIIKNCMLTDDDDRGNWKYFLINKNSTIMLKVCSCYSFDIFDKPIYIYREKKCWNNNQELMLKQPDCNKIKSITGMEFWNLVNSLKS